MSDKMKVSIKNLDGSIHQEIGTVMNILNSNELWSEYSLEDGTKIRLKQTVLNIVKLDEKNPNGDPIYSIQSQQTMSVIPKIE